MNKMCNKILSLVFFIANFSAYAGKPIVFTEKSQSIQLDKEIFITPVNENDNFSEIDYQLVNNQNSGIKFFLDQTPYIYIDAHDITIKPKTIDSTILNIDGYEFRFKGYSNFFIEGLSKGDHEVELTFIPFNAKQKAGAISLEFKAIETTPLFTNDAIAIGLLLLLLALIFYTSNLPFLKKFYGIVPALLLCYFLPAALNSLNIISGEYSNLYFVSSRYLLPASLILLCLSIDLKGIIRLGPKALIMFFAGTLGIIIGGPIALMIVASIAPEWLGADAGEIWRGLATVAGSWIGGGANQTAMKVIYETPNDIFSKMIVVDVLVANVWMAVLLYGAGIHKKIDAKFKADSSAITSLKEKMESFAAKVARIPSTTDLMIIIGIGVSGAGFAHILSKYTTPYFQSIKETLESIGLTSFTSGFFWLIVFSTIIGVGLSFTKLKNYEGAGASKLGSIFLYVLVAAIGTHMNFTEIFESPSWFVIGGIWMLIHAIIILGVARIIRAPFFFVAVGSQANVGGAASAPVVASAFSPSLAPVGVLLAVLGYAVGTFGAMFCAELMKAVEISGQ